MIRCPCGAPHPVLNGGRYCCTYTAEMLALDDGVTRLDSFDCPSCRSTRSVVVRPLPEPAYPRLVACGPASARVHVGGPVWLTPRGYVHLEDLLPAEAYELAPRLSMPELEQLTGLAWAAALARLGVVAVCRPARRAA